MGFVSRPDVTQADLRRQYRRPPSLVGHLPWLEYLPAPQCFLLEDGRSVGALFELEQVACEARPDRFLKTLRDTLQNAITHSIPEEDNPWVLQCYLQDEPDLTAVHTAMRDYVQPAVQGSAYTTHYLAHLAQHLEDVCRPGGLFIDEAVTGAAGRGQRRRVRGTLYRRQDSRRPGTHAVSPEEELNDVLAKLFQTLRASGLRVQRGGGREFYEWLLPWFTPAPPMTGGNAVPLLALAPYPGDDDGDHPSGHGPPPSRTDRTRGLRRLGRGRARKARGACGEARGRAGQQALSHVARLLSPWRAGAADKRRRCGLRCSAATASRPSPAHAAPAHPAAAFAARHQRLQGRRGGPRHSRPRQLSSQPPYELSPAPRQDAAPLASRVRRPPRQSAAGLRPGTRQRPPGPPVLQPRRGAAAVRPLEPLRPQAECPHADLRAHRSRQDRHLKLHPEHGDGALSPAALSRRGRQLAGSALRRFRGARPTRPPRGVYPGRGPFAAAVCRCIQAAGAPDRSRRRPR